jgi:hypothetical protein
MVNLHVQTFNRRINSKGEHMKPEIPVKQIRELLEKAKKHIRIISKAYYTHAHISSTDIEKIDHAIGEAYSTLPPECETCGGSKEIQLQQESGSWLDLPCPDCQSQEPKTFRSAREVFRTYLPSRQSQEPKQTETEFVKTRKYLIDLMSMISGSPLGFNASEPVMKHLNVLVVRMSKDIENHIDVCKHLEEMEKDKFMYKALLHGNDKRMDKLQAKIKVLEQAEKDRIAGL